MADTGPPWDLPYPLPTDLVRDGADAIKDLAEATATGLSLAGNEGIGPNAVVATTTTDFTTTDTAYQDVTGLEVTITPSTDTARVLVLASFNSIRHDANNTGIELRLTASSGASDIRIQFATGPTGPVNYPASGLVLHSPGSASPVTYKIQAARIDGSGTVRVRSPFSLVAIEVDG